MAKSPVLFVLILFITFPVWIALGGMAFGLFMGMIGIIFGLIGAIFGVFFGMIGGIFHLLFGFGSWHHGHHFLFNKYIFLALIITLALVIHKRSKRV